MKENLPISKSVQSSLTSTKFGGMNRIKTVNEKNSLSEAQLRNPLLQMKKKISVGSFCELKITALGPKNVGIDEFSYGFSILIPKATLGETVKVQIKRIFNLKKAKYAVAQRTDLVKKSIPDNKSVTKNDVSKTAENAKGNMLSVGDILTVKLDHIAIKTDSSCIGLANLVRINSGVNEPTQILIPLDPQIKGGSAQVGQEIKIQITKIKLKYALARPLLNTELLGSALSPVRLKKSGLNTTLRNATERSNYKQLTKGSKITLTLPKTAKKYAKHIVILLKKTSSSEDKPHVLFLTNRLGAKFGDKVRVKFTKIGSTFAIGKILRIAPNSPLKKLARARKNLKEMLANGMHYGEKVVKCQAKMRSYIWNRKKVTRQNRLSEKRAYPSANSRGKGKLATYSPKQLGGKEGVQGKGLSLKGDKNSPLIKKGRHLINLLKTRRCLNIGLNQLTKYAAKGRTFLFVGTKKPAAGLIARAALFSKTSFFVNTRWLGGMLTNWKTIVKSISKIRPILKEKQKVISNILQKRAIIQNRLIKKVLSLRKKSKVLIKKGKQLIEKVKNLSAQTQKNQKSGVVNNPIFSGILIKRKALFERGQFLLQKRQSLLNKQSALKEKTLQVKEHGFLIANKYKVLLNKLTATHKKLHDIRLMFILNKELRNITKLAKEQGKNQYTLSYGKFKQFSSLALDKEQSSSLGTNVHQADGLVTIGSFATKKLWLIPNPPQEILNKILITISGFAANNVNSQNPLKNKGVLRSSLQKQPGVAKTSSANFSVKEKNNNSLPIPTVKKGESDDLFSSDLKKSIILTKLLSKFSRFLPYIKNAISSMLRLMLGMVKKMAELKTHLKDLKTKLMAFLLFNKKIDSELKLIQRKYTSEQQIIRVLRRKLKRHEAEKKLLQFLPKLRYLPTPKSQIALAIQILMKRFVDPKMKYPMDLIYDEKLRKKSKKVAAARKKKWQRLETYFGGIANMTKLRKTQISNNVAIIIGQQEEMNAVLECKKLGIKMFHIVDTNCNPGLADHFIPSNDDSRNSIKYLLTKIVTRIRLAQKIRLRFKVL